jgi:hypothetical protein
MGRVAAARGGGSWRRPVAAARGGGPWRRPGAAARGGARRGGGRTRAAHFPASGARTRARVAHRGAFSGHVTMASIGIAWQASGTTNTHVGA